MKQINKAQARKLYAEGKEFTIVPANMRPDSMFAVHMKKGWMWRNFDNFYNEFRFYNCNNNEVGYYPRFYVDD